MPGLYFPKKENLSLITDEEKHCIEEAVILLKDNLPWDFRCNASIENIGLVQHIDFYKDKGMDGTAVLGYTTFFKPNEILLSPLIVDGLTWTNNQGIPNNESVMSTVIHELTHLRQMQWFYGLAWMFLNIPLVASSTIEKWANDNGAAATELLSKHYDGMRIPLYKEN